MRCVMRGGENGAGREHTPPTIGLELAPLKQEAGSQAESTKRARAVLPLRVREPFCRAVAPVLCMVIARVLVLIVASLV